MTNELEKQFFDTFGIEPKDNFKGCENGITFYTYGCNIPSCKGCSKEIRGKEYPQISDRILLELICIISSNPISVLFEPMLGEFKEIELLKKSILLTCIANEDVIKHQVRTLFEEG